MGAIGKARRDKLAETVGASEAIDAWTKRAVRDALDALDGVERYSETQRREIGWLKRALRLAQVGLATGSECKRRLAWEEVAATLKGHADPPWSFGYEFESLEGLEDRLSNQNHEAARLERALGWHRDQRKVLRTETVERERVLIASRLRAYGHEDAAALLEAMHRQVTVELVEADQ